MKKAILIALVALFLLNIGFSQGVDRVILSSDLSSVDTFVAVSAGNKDGAPVIVLVNKTLTAEIEDELKSLEVKIVIIVGGPAAVDPNVEGRLKTLGYEVVWLWGIERTGTALKVAKYFWPEGAPCAFLVEDRMNYDIDHPLQVSAVTLASQRGCPLIPVPRGKVPAEVVALLAELGTENVTYIGREIGPAIRDALREFRLREIVGSEEEIEEEVEEEIVNETEEETGKKPLLVVVAAPSWRESLGIGAHPNEHSVVKLISSIDQVPALITFIQENNITRIKVVGIPWLASDIAEALRGAGIEPEMVVAEKASDVAREVFRRMKDRWANLTQRAIERFERARERVEEEIEEELNETVEELEEEEVEMERRGRIADAIRRVIAAKKGLIAHIKDLLAEGKIRKARRLTWELMNQVRVGKWLLRDRIRWRWKKDLEDEEESIEEAIEEEIEEIEEVEKNLSDLEARGVNISEVRLLVEHAKRLKEIVEGGRLVRRYRRAMRILRHVRKLVRLAHELVKIGLERARIPPEVRERVRECIRRRRRVVERAFNITLRERMSPQEVEEYMEKLGRLKACEVDSDCVRVKGDCCGCSMGGVDTCVNMGYQSAWNDELEKICEEIACVAWNRCIEGTTCKCIASECTLAT
jgi:putative cell wall-binding protein